MIYKYYYQNSKYDLILFSKRKIQKRRCSTVGDVIATSNVNSDFWAWGLSTLGSWKPQNLLLAKTDAGAFPQERQDRVESKRKSIYKLRG